MKALAKTLLWGLLTASAALTLPACQTSTDSSEEAELGRAKGAFSSYAANADVSGCTNGAPDGTCEPGENPFTCAQDCSCGDGKCGGTETPLSCPVDCTFPNGGNASAGAYCGNGRCDPWEVDDLGVILCEQDCKLAPDLPGTQCGNYSCEPGETSATCPADCGNKALCGNGVCEPSAGEHYNTCPADCTSSALLPGKFLGTSCSGAHLVAHYSDGLGGVTDHVVSDLAGGCNDAYPWKLMLHSGTCNGSQLMKPDGSTCTIQNASCTNDIAGKFTPGTSYLMSQEPNKCGTYTTMTGQLQPVEWTKVGVQTCTLQSPCTVYTCTGAAQTIKNGPVSLWAPQIARWSIYAQDCQ